MRGSLLRLALPLASSLLLGACGEDRPDAPAASPRAAARPAVAPSPSQVAEAERLGVPASFENDLGMRFVLVPSGTFRMGDAATPADAPGEEPDHEVRIFGAFYLQDAEVTEAAWAAWRGGPAGPRPATGVSHDEAVAFAAWLTARDARWLYRLPTEAEWDRAHHAEDEVPREGSANAWGLAGMYEAPWEWCADWFGPLPSWQVTNPTGPDRGGERVLRGAPEPGASRIGRRRAAPDARPSDAGVRLAAGLSYGKAGFGACDVTFRTVDPDAEDPAGAERPGYIVRILAVIDRLMARQRGLDLPWVDLPGRSSPQRISIPPGRYYAIALRIEDGHEIRGLEKKFDADPGALTVLVPVPKPGAMLRKPQ